MTLNKKPDLDARGLFHATSDLLQNDDEFVNETLRSQGLDPEAIASKGNSFLQKLKLQNRASQSSLKKTAIFEEIKKQVIGFMQSTENLISSSLIPGRQGNKDQVYNMLCNKFQELRPEDIQGIMEDDAVLKEIERIYGQSK